LTEVYLPLLPLLTEVYFCKISSKMKLHFEYKMRLICARRINFKPRANTFCSYLKLRIANTVTTIIAEETTTVAETTTTEHTTAQPTTTTTAVETTTSVKPTTTLSPQHHVRETQGADAGMPQLPLLRELYLC